MNAKPLRIAMLTHSTLPRGGVVHALELAEALHARGHRVSLIAPDAAGRGFFRTTTCDALPLPAQPVADGLLELVRTRAAEVERQLVERGLVDRFDVWHAQDAITANALATLTERGAIHGFVRTVHHLDRYDDERLVALQRRAFVSAARVLCVSRLWRERLGNEQGVVALQVANGVDTLRYTPRADAADALVRAGLGYDGRGPLLLAVGGVEARKNTLAILHGYVALRATHPTARLVIAGGASLLDHTRYRAAFDADLAASGLTVAHGLDGSPADVRVTGPLDDALMPALYRAADALLFPSLEEGFGLVVLEALASDVPVVVSRIAPFTEHLDDRCVSWCEPRSPESIAAAARAALGAARARASIAAARPLLATYGWAASAARHETIYREWLGGLAASRMQPERAHA